MPAISSSKSAPFSMLSATVPCQPPRRQPGRLIEGEDPLAAAAAQIVGALVTDGADEAQRGVAAVRVELGRLAAMRASHAGPLVSVFFLRQVPLDGLGGDPVGQGADPELVVAGEVGVVAGQEVGGQLVDLGGDGVVDLARESLDVGLLLGRYGCRGHEGLRFRGRDSPHEARIRSCVQRFHQLSRRPPLARVITNPRLTAKHRPKCVGNAPELADPSGRFTL
jgi:hypothetical protein